MTLTLTPGRYPAKVRPKGWSKWPRKPTGVTPRKHLQKENNHSKLLRDDPVRAKL